MGTVYVIDCPIEFDEAETDEGNALECVFATCPNSGVKVGPIWGQGDRSIRRALATLSSKCPCGCFHQQQKRQGRTDRQ